MKCRPDETLGDLGRDLPTASGHDVSTVAMQGSSGAADDALYRFCATERRVLIALDRDFGEILRFAPEDTAGIAIVDFHGRLSPASIRARIKEPADLLAVEPIEGRLWIVEPGRVRVHGPREGNRRHTSDASPCVGPKVVVAGIHLTTCAGARRRMDAGTSPGTTI
jgi:hypothetical protein